MPRVVVPNASTEVIVECVPYIGFFFLLILSTRFCLPFDREMRGKIRQQRLGDIAPAGHCFIDVRELLKRS
jgi:hypothetical protein